MGYLIVSHVPALTGAFIQAFAAGALLTMVADEMAPEAHSRAGITTGLATTLGFILAVFLSSFE